MRLLAIALLCGQLTGCAVIAAALSETLVWSAGEVAVSAGLGGALALAGALESKHCDGAIHSGVTVAGADRNALLMSGPSLEVFEPTLWQSATMRSGRVEPEPESESLEGAFALADASVLFVPTSGTPGFRVPYELIVQVDIRENPVHALLIRSCLGRVDRFTFWRSARQVMDAKATSEAAAALKRRLDAFHRAHDVATKQ